MLVNYATKLITDRLPKVLNPRQHAVADYMVAGTCFIFGAIFWARGNRRAAVAAVTCGAAATANTLITDFPGGVTKLIDFKTHGQIDGGLALATGAMPNLMGFSDTPESGFFRILALGETAVAAMTDFDASRRQLDSTIAA